MTTVNFLNIDLEIESKDDLSLIVTEFGDKVAVLRNELHEGVYSVSFETGCSEENEIIEKYETLIGGLRPKAKRQWDHCIKRVFDFGFEYEDSSDTFHFEISENAVKLLAKLGGSVAVTFYRSQEMKE